MDGVKHHRLRGITETKANQLAGEIVSMHAPRGWFKDDHCAMAKPRCCEAQKEIAAAILKALRLRQAKKGKRQ